MPLVEVHHDLLQNVLVHLPVRRSNARMRDKLQQMLAHAVNALYTVVDKVDLPSACKLALNRAAHHLIAALHDIGLHGQTIGRRRLNDAHIARSSK